MRTKIDLKLLALASGLTATGLSASTPENRYQPVRCSAPAAYAGPALHSPPTAADLAVGGSIDGSFEADRVARFEAAFAVAAGATQAQAITAAVAIPGQGIWTGQQGWTQPLFYWASVGKEATAVVVLQLAEEGKLKLSDPVSKWVKGVPNGDAISLETLLAHTSGLFSANEDPEVRQRGERLSLDRELDVLRRHGAMFCPGAQWRYSNSGYVLLGRVVEQVDGRSLAEAITARIIRPLGLTEMRVIDAAAPLADIALSFTRGSERVLDIRTPGAAGPIAASARDMFRFQQAVLDGTLLRPESRTRMLARLYPMFGAESYYGLGVMLWDVPDGAQRLYWIGHAGGAPGVRAIVAFAPRQHAFVAVALTGDGEAVPAANLLLKNLAGPS